MLLEIKNGIRTNPTGRGQRPRIMVLRCDVCGVTYERPYSKVYVEQAINRCGAKRCTYGTRKSDGLGGHGAEIIETKCAVCEKLLRHRKIGNERKWGKMCSRRCYGTYRSQHPELYAANIAAMQMPDVRKRAVETREALYASGELTHPRLGKHHSDETRKLMRQRKVENPPVGEKNGM